MGSAKQAVKQLVKKLEFNPVPLGGKSIFTTPLGIVLGAIVMIIVAVYAFGKVAYLEDSRNVDSNTYQYQNDPYEVDLSEWDPRISIYENISGRYVTPSTMFQLGLNVTAWNKYGQDLIKSNPSSLIQYQGMENMMTLDHKKTPFVVSGSNYVHESPHIKEYLIEIQPCDAAASGQCRDSKNKVYSIVLYLKPKWAYLENPKEPGIREMNFNQKVTIDQTKAAAKFEFTYDVFGFNMTSDTSLLPAFFPRTVTEQKGSSMAGPATKVYLPQESKSFVEFHFRRSERSESYTRKFNSIDTIFAEILGVVALFGLILWFLFAHYTRWGSEEFILRSIEGTHKSINLFQYLKFYLTCQKRTAKQQKVLEEVHQNVIQSYKQRKRRKIEIEILKLRATRIESKLNMQDNQGQCKQEILEKLEEDEKNELFSSSVLTQEIRRSLLTN